MTKEIKDLITPGILSDIGYTNTANVHGDAKFIPDEYELKDKLEEWFMKKYSFLSMEYDGNVWSVMAEIRDNHYGSNDLEIFGNTRLEALLNLYHAIKEQ